MGRHKQGQDHVLRAELLESGSVLAAMAIEDQDSPLAMRMLGVFIEMIDPLNTKLIIYSAIVTNSSFPCRRKASLVPLCLMNLCSKDDEWWFNLALSIHVLNFCNPLPVTWLFFP